MRLAALFFVLFVAPAVHAHALGATVTLRGKQVEVEAYYSDNTPARDAKVEVHDHAGHLWTEGRTDDQGKWQFPVLKPGPYDVTVDAGAGHRTSKRIVIPAVLPSGPTGPISQGPTRDEFTRFPWVQVALGLAIIAALAFSWRALKRRFGRE